MKVVAGVRSSVFVLVGVLGFGLQLLSLQALTAGLGLAVVPATAVAVECAILHNFLWHERWTWGDRVAANPGGVWRRLARFQLTSGVVSITGNVLVTFLVVAATGIPLMVANTVAVASCAVLNFMAADRLVFSVPGIVEA